MQTDRPTNRICMQINGYNMTCFIVSFSIAYVKGWKSKTINQMINYQFQGKMLFDKRMGQLTSQKGTKMTFCKSTNHANHIQL